MDDLYSPDTGEHIVTDTPADWMAHSGKPAPQYDRATNGCFWRGADWEIIPFLPDPIPVPQAISRRQGRLALLGAGLLDQVEAMITAIEDPSQRRAAQIEYDADTWERQNAFVLQMWSLLGKTEGELNAVFIEAAALK